MVRIAKDGIFFEFIEVDEDGNETPKKIDVLSTSLGIASYLTFNVSIDEDVTVEDIMNFLYSCIETTDFIFDSSLGGYSFISFYNDMKTEEITEISISGIEVSHEIDFVTDDEDFFSIARFRGVADNFDLYSVEFLPISSYKNLKVKLNKKYCVKKMIDDKELVVLNTTKPFTLFEVIHSMLYEMSYYGEPQDREAALDEVAEAFGLEKENAGEMFRLKDRDTVDNMKKDLQILIDQEKYEDAAKLRDKIKSMLDPGEEQIELN